MTVRRRPGDQAPADQTPEEIHVVTSDRGNADQVRSLKATIESAEPFRRQVEAA
jgi:hypothetical protein